VFRIGWPIVCVLGLALRASAAEDIVVRVAAAPTVHTVPLCLGKSSVHFTCTAATSCKNSEWDLPSQLPAEINVRRVAGVLTLQSVGCWAAPITIGLDTASVIINVWPSGTLVGGLRPIPKGAISGKSVHVDSVTDAIPIHTDCPLREDQFTCELPAGALDLRISVDGFIPEYLWGIRVPTRGGHKVASVQLTRGSSLSGWGVSSGGR